MMVDKNIQNQNEMLNVVIINSFIHTFRIRCIFQYKMMLFTDKLYCVNLAHEERERESNYL